MGAAGGRCGRCAKSPGTRPILVIHSDDDRSVPIQQAVDFVDALENAGVQHRFVHYTDRGHMRITEQVIEETLAFIAELEGR
jgi:dipeptidyl aminopeptidase/acylaminoacyl peptidase